MNDHRHSGAEYCICAIFGTVTHAVMAPISCYDQASTYRLQSVNQLALVFLPIYQNGREEKFLCKQNLAIKNIQPKQKCTDDSNFVQKIFLKFE